MTVNFDFETTEAPIGLAALSSSISAMSYAGWIGVSLVLILVLSWTAARYLGNAKEGVGLHVMRRASKAMLRLAVFVAGVVSILNAAHKFGAGNSGPIMMLTVAVGGALLILVALSERTRGQEDDLYRWAPWAQAVERHHQ